MRYLLSASAFVVLTLAITAPLAAQAAGGAGKVTYDKWCAGCHGVQGDGAGPSALRMLPRPRNFTLGLFRFARHPAARYRRMPT